MTTLYRLQSIFRRVFDDPTLGITSDTSVTTLPDWDSVATVQIILTVEAEFGIRFNMDEVVSINSVATILDFIEKHTLPTGN